MLIDNKVDRYPLEGTNIITVWDFLRTYSGKECGDTGILDIVTGYFTIKTLSKLYEEMPEEDHFRIISSEMVGDDYKKDLIVNLLSDDMDISSIGNLDKEAEQAIAFLERKSVEMRAEIPDFCHAKAYIFKNNVQTHSNYYVTGSSNLTPAGLGIKAVPNVELNIAETCNNQNAHYTELRKWYEDIWSKARTEVPEDGEKKKSPKISVKEYFIRKIKEYFRKYSPEEIYYKILFELFNADLDLEEGIEHQKDMSLLQTSEIWNTLFDYQQKGVISLIKMLRKYNGAILADAVGLGKTFSALAVIKYFQTQNYTTIVLCPKKLEQNWMQYKHGTGSRFENDEFTYEVRYHTDLQNDRLQSYPTFKLDYLQKRKKVLLVIDESHNLRNEKSSRYNELMESLVKNQLGNEDRDVKVLMLSATPINTGLKDVKGQFNLIGHGKDNAFDNEEFGVESLRNTFKDAQTKYTTWCANQNRTIGGFISMLPQQFFNLTDKLIVARTRKLIERVLGEDLGFPDKERPTNVYQGVDHFGEFTDTQKIYEAFEKLTLTAYQPSMFLHESRKEARKEAKKDWDDDINREMFLVKMMSILFMKRLESSWFSCMTTIKKVLDVHEQTLKLVLDYEEHMSNGTLPTGAEDDINEEDDDIIDELFSLRKGEIKLSDLKNLGGFKKGLQHDVNQLNKIYNALQDFEKKYRSRKESDLKLDELVKILNKKKDQPNKKVVIFTAYADTAQFLFDELNSRGFTRMASVSGSTVLSTGNHNKSNFTETLQSFAPYSKLYKELKWDELYEKYLDPAIYYKEEKDGKKAHWEVPYSLWQELVMQHNPQYARLLNDGIDILIATDCLSEGQNLQDADLQINYDIHWNPVRLIQRFGRIDRIGSPNKTISCVNFWPAKSFEDYLNLETRIQNRMSLMTLVGGEKQELNEAYIKMVEDNPLQDKNADRLLMELTNNSISDIESPQTLSLKDLTQEIYRQDLVEFIKEKKDFFKRMPNGVFSGFKNNSEFFPNMPECLVALVGYPKKPEGKKEHKYTEFCLICQPVYAEPEFKELNRVEVLEFLRQNKKADRYVPNWITDNDTVRVTKLSDALKLWMNSKLENELFVISRNPRKFISDVRAGNITNTLNDKYQIDKFDLIVWEYISK
ncbi:MAG: DEAD/DEAH box helicase family protein [Muribaculaceae bacterium]|nr:DEAD/DEAH box helicase family protein [Muribaculaceae bacterium]